MSKVCCLNYMFFLVFYLPCANNLDIIFHIDSIQDFGGILDSDVESGNEDDYVDENILLGLSDNEGMYII